MVVFAGDVVAGDVLVFVCPVWVLYGAVGGDGNRSASTTSTETATIAARAIITRLDSRRCRRRCAGRERGRDAIDGLLGRRPGIVVAGVELVDERLPVEAEVLRVGAQEALRVRRARQDVEILVLERADVARADRRLRLDLAVAQVAAFAGFPE